MFEKASALQIKANSSNDASLSLVEAYKAYKTVSPSEAARCLSKAIEYFTSQGQFGRAARFKADLGELYLVLNERENAIKSFEDAGEWHSLDSAESLANKNFLRAADLKAENGQYLEAAQVYESIAEKTLDNMISKWNLKDYAVKSVLCRLAASDYVGAVNKLEAFVSWDSTFQGTIQYKFLSQLLDAVKERDPDLIGKASADFDSFSRLDKWKIALLTKIKDATGGSDALGLSTGGDMDEDDLT